MNRFESKDVTDILSAACLLMISTVAIAFSKYLSFLQTETELLFVCRPSDTSAVFRLHSTLVYFMFTGSWQRRKMHLTSLTFDKCGRDLM